MEKKEENKTPNQSQTTNNVTNSGPNYGTIAGEVNFGGLRPSTDSPLKPKTEEQPTPVEQAIWKSNVVELISKGQTKEALAEILKTNPPEDIRNQIALLAGRLSQLELEKIAGISDKSLELLELNNIRNGILTLISRY